MPSKSEKQRRLMQAVLHNPKVRKDTKIPLSVAHEFVEADKRARKKKKDN